MLTPTEEKRRSKFLSLLLRHRPDTLNLTLDQSGWIAVDTLLEALTPTEHTMTADDLVKLVQNNDKQRFVFSPDGRKIRAAQGHSVPVDLGLVPSVPPERLYHGTVQKFLDDIRKDGLKAMQRRQVHLSADRATALKVGSRRGTPIILEVRAGAMQDQGFEFYLAENGVWLTDSVPPAFILEG